MTETKFTRPPWSVHPLAPDHDGWFEDVYVIRTDGLAVAVALQNGDISPEEAMAHGHLISAAPELFEISRIFLGEDDRFQVAVGGNPIAVEVMLTSARAALAKARGEGG